MKTPRPGQLLVEENNDALLDRGSLDRGALGSARTGAGRTAAVRWPDRRVDHPGTKPRSIPRGAGSTEFNCTPPPNIPGIDERRASAQVDWRWSFLAGAVRIDPFLSARGDFYSLADLPERRRKSPT